MQHARRSFIRAHVPGIGTKACSPHVSYSIHLDFYIRGHEWSTSGQDRKTQEDILRHGDEEYVLAVIRT